MNIIKSSKEMQNIVTILREKAKKIAFVPTMGYLHEGHLSLVRKAKEYGDIVVVSIFVNPTQFGINEDLNRYPKDFDKDCSLLANEKVDYVFYPDAEDIYPKNYLTYINVNKITSILEGKTRPTHFQGVTTIVAILFNIVKPQYAVFGQKDAQQVAVISKMVEDLKYEVELIISPTIREKDGLAMSSRNTYLSVEEKKDSIILYNTLKYLESEINSNKLISIKELIQNSINKINKVNTAKLDYLKLVDFNSFEELTNLQDSNKILILIACYIGKTRLIDNFIINID